MNQFVKANQSVTLRMHTNYALSTVPTIKDGTTESHLDKQLGESQVCLIQKEGHETSLGDKNEG